MLGSLPHQDHNASGSEFDEFHNGIRSSVKGDVSLANGSRMTRHRVNLESPSILGEVN